MLLQTTHASAGVEKGLRAANQMPVEVMGFMLGHVDTEVPRALVVTDVSDGISNAALAGQTNARLNVLQVFPLPVEGTETQVMTDNQEVINYMIQLSDSLEDVSASAGAGLRATC
jgi:hypothetical protein